MRPNHSRCEKVTLRARRPRRRSPLLTVIALATLLLGAATPALAAHKRHAKREPADSITLTPQVRGVNLSLTRAFSIGPVALSSGESSEEVQSACRLGAQAVRLMVAWYKLESLPRVLDQTLVGRLQSLVDQANSCGIRVILDLLGTPKWDSRELPLDTNFAAYPGRTGAAEYGWMVSWILKRWPGLYGLEVWNEPNARAYWRGSAAEYAQLVNAAVAAKRREGSRALILGAVLAGGDARYLQDLYAAGMRGQDGISIHPYSVTCRPSCDRFVDPTSPTGPFRAGIEAVHRVMAENGDTGGIWLTEFGFASCPAQPVCVGEDVQAAWMSKSLELAACYPYVAGLTAFSLHNAAVPSSWDETSWTLHFGLMNPDFTPKPAYGAVQRTLAELRRMESDPGVRRPRKRGRHGKRRKAARASNAAGRMCRSLLGQPRSKKAKRRKRHRRR